MARPSPKRILVTGGAGFVGSALSLALRRRWPDASVIAFDNLRRRGSELNLPRLKHAGVEFVHGDIRAAADLTPFADALDLLIECSAEPSVLAGYGGDPSYVLDTNLGGTVHCLEVARRSGAAVVFLSTSRVYPIALLNGVTTREAETRFEIAVEQRVAGVSPDGIAEDFPLEGARSIYGATKLASELIVEEYRAAFGVPTLINRCGVLAGPWQMGKADQGVFSLWMARHLSGGTLTYNGWGGTGKQVRDLLHIDDLTELVLLQVDRLDDLSGRTFNVGGGPANSLSLQETTALVREITGRETRIAPVLEVRTADVKLYITDNARVTAATGWRPTRSPRVVLQDLHRWMLDHADALSGAGL